MHHRYLLITILMLPLFLHGMNLVEVKQQDEHEEAAYVYAISQHYKLMLHDGRSLDLSAEQLEQSSYLATRMPQKFPYTIHLDAASTALLKDLSEFKTILRIIAENKENPQQGLLKLFADSTTLHLHHVHMVAEHFGILPLQAVVGQLRLSHQRYAPAMYDTAPPAGPQNLLEGLAFLIFQPQEIQDSPNLGVRLLLKPYAPLVLVVMTAFVGGILLDLMKA